MNQEVVLTRKRPFFFDATLLLIVAGILAVFVVRTLLAARGDVPRLEEIFTTLTLAGSLVILISGYQVLRKLDWLVSFAVGALVGVGVVFATLFNPFPVFGMIDGDLGQALVRGGGTTVALLGGLVIMRRGGPVQVLAANGEWRRSAMAVLLGLVLGLPLAVVNMFANQYVQGRPVSWQNPLAALLDALQPGIVEEVIYRFAFLGLAWLALRKPLPRQAPWIAGLLALLVHNYSHYDDLFVQAPLAAIGMGLVMGILWGLPMTILALRRGLESSIAFHWIVDVARFVAGF